VNLMFLEGVYAMLSQYEAIKKLGNDSPAKKDLIAGAEETLQNLVGRLMKAGFTKEDILRLIDGITEHEIDVQRALFADAHINSPNMQQREAKIKQLQAKWELKDDSEQKRKISDLIFVDFSTLGKASLAILDDNISAYKEEWKKEELRWGRSLELACLAGSRNIGEFIISQKEINISVEGWGTVLSYISTSGNNDWAVECAKRMNEKGMDMPQEFCSYCEDFELIDQISDIFAQKNKDTSKPF